MQLAFRDQRRVVRSASGIDRGKLNNLLRAGALVVCRLFFVEATSRMLTSRIRAAWLCFARLKAS